MKYIDNKEELGIEYDWQLIRKEYAKLKVPKEYDFIGNIPFEKVNWSVLNSLRSIGKTTNFLLLGMIMNKQYGTIIQYIRNKEDEIKASNVSELFSTILSYKNGYYIKKITNNEYNSVTYHWKKIYYCNVDEKGKIIEKAETPFLQFLSVDRNMEYKSSYNAPLGDFIILDEFISRYTRQDAFSDFCDLLKTIIRDRLSAKIFLLANTIDINSLWFRELTIDKEIKKMKIGENRIVFTNKNMPIYIALLGVKNVEKRKNHNSNYFGFDNPKLASITGSDTWAFKEVPHIFRDNKKVLYSKIYFQYYVEIFRVDIVKTEKIGIILEIHPATRTYSDSIIYKNTSIQEKNEIFMLGKGNNIDKWLYSMFKNGKVFYSDNATGDAISKYIYECENKKRY